MGNRSLEQRVSGNLLLPPTPTFLQGPLSASLASGFGDLGGQSQDSQGSHREAAPAPRILLGQNFRRSQLPVRTEAGHLPPPPG